MKHSLHYFLLFMLVLGSCVSGSRNKTVTTPEYTPQTARLDIPADRQPDSLTNLDRTPDGSFVLAPGFYEATFKSFCLQPGTPDPSSRDAYLQAPISGYRKEIVETILYESRRREDIPQRNVQLLLWSVVSGSDFNKLPSRIQNEAQQILSPKQIFELRGGVMGMVKTVSGKLPYGFSNGTDDVRRLFEIGASSYEAFERMAVLRTPSQIKRPDYKIDQWYKQKENYYVRYFPVSYQNLRIQVYVPDGLLDSTGKKEGEYLVFDPSSWLAVPANSNAQRLGVGGPVLDVVKKVIQISRPVQPKTLPAPTPAPPTNPKQPRKTLP